MSNLNDTSEKNKEVQDNFVGRTEIIDNFWDKLHKIETGEEPYYIITYTGNGGIGKSELLKKIERELNNLNNRRDGKNGSTVKTENQTYNFKKKYIPVRFDFEVTVDIVEVLSYLRVMIDTKNKMQFPIFDYAIARYEELMFREIGINKRTNSNNEVAANVSKIASIFIGVDVIETGKSLKTLLKIAVDNEKKKNPALKQWYEEIEKADADHIRKNLNTYFARDMDSIRNENRNSDCFVFLLDTFELIQYSEKYETLQKILELVAGKEIDNVMWILAGSRRIEINNTHHENVVVGNFSKEESEKYLENRGITKEKEEIIVEKIHEISEGSPIFLQLAADTYHNMSPEDRANVEKIMNAMDREELIKRYMKYLSDGDQLVLYMMSSMMHWRREDFKAVFNKVHNNSWSQYIRNYNRVNETLMIKDPTSNEGLALHRVVRDLIYTDPNYPSENKHNTRGEILSLYQDKIKGNPMDLIYYKERIVEIIKRAVRISEPLSGIFERMALSILYNSAYELKCYGHNHIFDYIGALEEYKLISNKPNEVEETITNLLDCIGIETEKISRLEGILNDKVQKLGKDSVDLIPNLKRLESEYRQNREQGKRMDTLNWWRSIVTNNPASSLWNKIDVDLEIANAYDDVGEKFKAQGIRITIIDEIEECIRNGISDRDEEKKLVAVIDRINSGLSIKEIERITHIREAVVNYRKKEYGNYSVSVVNGMLYLYEDLRSCQKYDEAQKVLDEVELIVYKKDGTYEDVLTKYNLLRNEYWNNNDKYNKITEAILEFIEKNNPEDVKRIIKERNFLQENLFNAKKIEEALEVNEGTVKIAEEYYSEEPKQIYIVKSRVLNVLSNKDYEEKKVSLIEELENFLLSHSWQDKEWLAFEFASLSGSARQLKNYENAVALMIKAIEAQIEKYGENHKNVYGYKRRLANLYHEMGEKEKSKELFEEIATGRLGLVKDNEEAYIDTLSDIADDWWGIGEYDVAEKKYDEVIEEYKKHYDRNSSRVRQQMLIQANRYSAHPNKIKKAISIYEELLSMDDVENLISKKEKLDICKQLSNLYSCVERTEEGIAILDTALKEYIEVAGKDDRETLGAMVELAILLAKVGREEEAIDRLEKGINEYKSKNGEDSKVIAAINNLAWICSFFDKKKEKELRDEAERIRASFKR